MNSYRAISSIVDTQKNKKNKSKRFVLNSPMRTLSGDVNKFLFELMM